MLGAAAAARGSSLLHQTSSKIVMVKNSIFNSVLEVASNQISSPTWLVLFSLNPFSLIDEIAGEMFEN